MRTVDIRPRFVYYQASPSAGNYLRRDVIINLLVASCPDAWIEIKMSTLCPGISLSRASAEADAFFHVRSRPQSRTNREYNHKCRFTYTESFESQLPIVNGALNFLNL